MSDDELPEGWRWDTIGGVADVSGGLTKNASKRDASKCRVPLVSVAAVHLRRIDVSAIGDVGLLESDEERATLVRGDLLVVEGNGSLEHIGRVALWNDEVPGARHQNHIIRVRPHKLSPRFVLEWMASSAGRAAIVDVATSATGLYTLSLSKVEGLPIPVPPLPEQRRIVAKLESLQARSRRAREALQAVPPLLEKLRQSILAAAFRGDLTKDWRENHPDVEPASELLKRIRVERRKKWEQAELAKMKAKGRAPTDSKWKLKYVEPEPVDESELPELPGGWVWASLDELTESSFYGPRFAASDYSDDGVPTIRTTDMDDTGRIRWRDPPRVKLDSRAYQEVACHNGDLLITRTGSIGKCAIYESDIGPAIPSAYLIRFRFVLSDVSPRFVFRQLQSPFLQSLLGLGTTATTQPNINARTLGSLPFAVCGLAEQRFLEQSLEIELAILEGQLARANGLQTSLASLDSAILSKAFRGELVPQEAGDAVEAQSDAVAESAASVRPGKAHRSSPPKRR